MQNFVVTVICFGVLILFFLVAYSIGYGDCEEDNEQFMQRTYEAYKEEIDMLKEKVKFYQKVELNKTSKGEKLDEVDQMVELFGYQGSKKARGDE